MTALPLRPRLRAATLAVLAVCALLATPVAGADDALKLYQQGLAALEKGSCAEAARSFQGAISKDAKETAKKRDYGTIFVQYVPHFQLAKALLCSGDAAGALAQLEISDQQGVSKGSERQSLRAQIEARLAESRPATPTPSPTPDRGALVQKALDEANEAYGRRDHAAARAAAERALAEDPANPRAKELLTRVAKDVERGRKVDQLLAEAQKAAGRKDYETAMARAQEAARLDPENAKAKALVQNIGVLMASAPPPTATPEATPTSTVTPMTPAQRAAAELAIGEALVKEGKLEEAITRFEGAKRLDPSNVAILSALADAQKRRDEQAKLARAAALVEEARHLKEGGKLRDAKSRVEQAKSIDPANQEARQLADELAKLIAGTAVATATPAAVDKTKLRSGVKLYYEGKYDEALTTLESAKAELGETASYHFYLGAIQLTRYLLAGESDPALKQRAEAAFRDARRLGYEPDVTVSSPRIVAAFQSVR